jgi:hypothetical protein
MPGFNQPLTINVIGHAAGAILFAIFLALLFSGRGWSGGRGRSLSALAAALALSWNLGSLIVLLAPGLPPAVLNLAVAASFSALTLLPAVLLQVWLAGRLPVLSKAGYLLSAIAIALHLQELRGGEGLHQTALMLITGGFVLLTVAALALLRSGSRMAASMSLALFAMSFVHFGEGHAIQAWSSELLIHHAGIPLALFLLLQDYRFVLLDAFVRFLANALLAACFTAGILYAVTSTRLTDPVRLATLAIALCLTLILYAWLRGVLTDWLTHALFRQADLLNVPAVLRNAPPFASEDEFLSFAAGLLARAARAESCAILPKPPAPPPAALIPLRLDQGDLRVIALGRRVGGLRYLRDDLDALHSAAAEIAARLDAMRRDELAHLAAQAELRALQAQIHPHFLFNALNTVYGIIPRDAAPARRMVLNLAEIFRYFLQSDKTYVPLEKEIATVRAYLEIEQARLGPRLRTELAIDPAALPTPIPVLSIQPLVENAIRHGVARSSEAGYVRLEIVRDASVLTVRVANSFAPESPENPGEGVGLRNVRRRLEICYGTAASLDLALTQDSAAATLVLPVT